MNVFANANKFYELMTVHIGNCCGIYEVEDHSVQSALELVKLFPVSANYRYQAKALVLTIRDKDMDAEKAGKLNEQGWQLLTRWCDDTGNNCSYFAYTYDGRIG